jgi:hypothetical protein
MRRLVLAAALAVLSTSAFAEYSFTVANNTESSIVGIEASEDGASWGQFDVGEGIVSGEASKLVWDASTDGGNCEWQFRATFADGSVSEPVAFDFCEEDLTLEFN